MPTNDFNQKSQLGELDRLTRLAEAAGLACADLSGQAPEIKGLSILGGSIFRGKNAAPSSPAPGARPA